MFQTTRSSSHESPTSKQIRDVSAGVRASGLKQVEFGASKVEGSRDAAATASYDEHMSTLVERSPERSSLVQHRATGSSQTSTDVAQAKAENENNLNVEAEHGRNTIPAVRLSIDNTVAAADCSGSNRPGISRADSKALFADNKSDRPILTVYALPSPVEATEKVQPVTVDLSGSCCDVDDMIFNIEERDFSDDEVVNSISWNSSLPSQNIGNRTTARSNEHGARTVGHRRTAENVAVRRSCDISTDSSKNERRRSADDSSSVIASKLQRRSFPSDTSNASMEKRTSELNNESMPNVDKCSGASSVSKSSSVSLNK